MKMTINERVNRLRLNRIGGGLMLANTLGDSRREKGITWIALYIKAGGDVAGAKFRLQDIRIFISTLAGSAQAISQTFLVTNAVTALLELKLIVKASDNEPGTLIFTEELMDLLENPGNWTSHPKLTREN